MHSQKLSLPLVLLLTIGSCGSANAGLVIDFSIDGGNTFGDFFQVDVVSPVDVGVFLVQSETDILLNEGLLGFGLSGRLSNDANGVIINGAIEDGFDFVTVETLTGTGLDWEASVFQNAIPTNSPIALGSFQFQADSEGTTLISIGDIQPGVDSTTVNWLTGLGTELDQQIFGSGSAGTFDLTLSTSAIPEPSPAYLLSFVLMALVIQRRIRRLN